MAFFARLTVAGITACEVYFFDKFCYILELEPEIDVEGLVVIADYFRIAGGWMQARFGIVPTTNENWTECFMYTAEWWESWKRDLRTLAERSDTTVRARVNEILEAMNQSTADWAAGREGRT